MNCPGYRFIITLAVAGVAGTLLAETLTLKASKDSFGRSNKRNNNNGGSPKLIVSQSPYIRSVIAFDLSEITNRIQAAEFRFQAGNTMTPALDLIIAPMAQTANNAAWGEGTGYLGVQGVLAKEGESSFICSAYPSTPWEGSNGKPVQDLVGSSLWLSPIAELSDLKWKEGEWITVRIPDVVMLEAIRQSASPVITFGVWGTAGAGIYEIKSKESGVSAELILTIEDSKEE